MPSRRRFIKAAGQSLDSQPDDIVAGGLAEDSLYRHKDDLRATQGLWFGSRYGAGRSRAFIQCGKPAFRR